MSHAAALARLTDNERECLRRRLRPQTAKEMAIDLGVSPHAVEKRLKMARAKLGLSSSLAAARLLAESEGYQKLAPQPSDLSARPAAGLDAVAAPPASRGAVHPLSKGTGMIAAIALAAVLAQDAPAQPPSPADADAYVAAQQASGRWRKADIAETEAYLRSQFKDEDTNGSGYLELEELDPSTWCARHQLTECKSQPAGRMAQPDQRMAQMDTDRDGKVSEDEHVSAMLPWALWQGVPANWRRHAR